MPSFAVIRPSTRPERPTATFDSLPREAMRMIVFKLKDDITHGIRLARAYPAYKTHVGQIIFTEYRARKAQDLGLFLQAINETPSFARFTTSIVLDGTLDNQTNSGVYTMLSAISTRQVQTPSTLLRALADQVNSGNFQRGYVPHWLHMMCFHILIANAVPNVRHLVMPEAWNYGGQFDPVIFFPNLESLSLT